MWWDRVKMMAHGFIQSHRDFVAINGYGLGVYNCRGLGATHKGHIGRRGWCKCHRGPRLGHRGKSTSHRGQCAHSCGVSCLQSLQLAGYFHYRVDGRLGTGGAKEVRAREEEEGRYGAAG